MWQNLEMPWKSAAELAWESYKSGSLPIAAVIVDLEGNVAAAGRNSILEENGINRKIAHAEMKALMALDYNTHPRIREYTMYATLEPCPMCMGAIVMCDMRKLRIAARDPWAGAVGICDYPYIASKNMDICFEDGNVSEILTVLYLCRLLEGYRKHDEFLTVLKDDAPKEFALSEQFCAQGTLRGFAHKGAGMEEVYNYIGSKMSKGR